MVNVVYYDEVIWETKLRWNSTTMETTNKTSDKLFPAASVTKVITVSIKLTLYVPCNKEQVYVLIMLSTTYNIRNVFTVALKGHGFFI